MPPSESSSLRRQAVPRRRAAELQRRRLRAPVPQLRHQHRPRHLRRHQLQRHRRHRLPRHLPAGVLPHAAAAGRLRCCARGARRDTRLPAVHRQPHHPVRRLLLGLILPLAQHLDVPAMLLGAVPPRDLPRPVRLRRRRPVPPLLPPQQLHQRPPARRALQGRVAAGFGTSYSFFRSSTECDAEGLVY